MASSRDESFRFVPALQRGRDDKQYDAFARDVLNSDIEKRATGVRRTIIDLVRMPADATDDEILEWAASWLGEPDEYLRQTGTTDQSRSESAKLYFTLNNAIKDAAEYLQSIHAERYLPKDAASIRILTPKDLVALVRKTVAFKGQGERAHPEQVKYCALIRAAIAAVETERREVLNLIGETEYVAKQLSQISEAGEPALLQYILPGKGKGKRGGSEPTSEDAKARFFSLAVRPDSRPEAARAISGELWWRAKARFQIMTKMLARPEASAETALKDGVGLRLMVDRDDVSQTMKNTAIWFTKRFGASRLQIINDNMYDQEEWERVQAHLAHPDLSRAQFKMRKKGENKISAGTFQTLKIVGEINVPSGGHPNSPLVRRGFEVQIVPRENRNDRKALNHHIYDIVKEVSVMTRLVGGCANSIFDQYVREAAANSKFTEEHIREVLLGTGRLVSHGRFIVDPSVWEEWQEAGIPGSGGEFGTQLGTKTARMRERAGDK